MRVNGVLLGARRGFDEPSVSVGEKVDVFIYRMFVTVGEKTYLLDNKTIHEEYVFI